jgi:gluconokinase
MPAVPGLRSPYDLVGGLVHFGRMIDKIRLHARGALPADYQPGLGTGGHDRVFCGFLQIDYVLLRDHVLSLPQATDAELLEWAYKNGRRLTPIDIVIINGFLSKRGWRDQSAVHLPNWLAKSSLPPDAAQTNFDYIELDEGRPARGVSVY